MLLMQSCYEKKVFKKTFNKLNLNFSVSLPIFYVHIFSRYIYMSIILSIGSDSGTTRVAGVNITFKFFACKGSVIS